MFAAFLASKLGNLVGIARTERCRAARVRREGQAVVAVCRAARGVRLPMSEDEELQRALQARLPPIARVPREAATLHAVNFTTTPLRR